MNKSTPTKKKPIKAHRGRIVYEGRGRPIGGGRPQIPRPFPGRPRPFPRPFPGRPSRRPNPFVSGPPRGGRRRTTPDVVRATQVAPRWANPAAEQALRRAMAERQQRNAAKQFQQGSLQAQRVGNKGMAVTKKAIGQNDFRKGGLTLSTVDNRKNK
tara:strand:- start:56 stop:523 length:468 start_codon:yes stop_codon:yes gene_type:complete